MNYEKACALIRTEVSRFQVEDKAALEDCRRICDHSPRLFIIAAGRSLLMMKAFAMRMMHLGYEVHILDEVTCPAITKQDVLIAASGSGTTAGILAKAKKAKALGAKLIVWTQSPASPMAELSDVCVSLQNHQSGQPGASLFEQSLLLALDAFVAAIMEDKALPPDEVYKRHANLE
ncbi:MAG: SIS domain-containing protein [Erysipelotrichaceae bacterium]|nr:SIS domain-containing protein [Erysipelotrichaceae bacterium]